MLSLFSLKKSKAYQKLAFIRDFWGIIKLYLDYGVVI